MGRHTYAKTVPRLRTRGLATGDVVIYFSIHPQYLRLGDNSRTIRPSPVHILAKGKFQRQVIFDLILKDSEQKEVYKRLHTQVKEMAVKKRRVEKKNKPAPPNQKISSQETDSRAHEDSQVSATSMLMHTPKDTDSQTTEPKQPLVAKSQQEEEEKKEIGQKEASQRDVAPTDFLEDIIFPDFDEIEKEAEMAPWRYAPVELPPPEHQRTEYKRSILLSPDEKKRIRKVIEASRSPPAEHYPIIQHPIFTSGEFTMRQGWREIKKRYPCLPKKTKAMLKERLSLIANEVLGNDSYTALLSEDTDSSRN